jgi:hypothetical protein
MPHTQVVARARALPKRNGGAPHLHDHFLHLLGVYVWSWCDQGRTRTRPWAIPRPRPLAPSIAKRRDAQVGSVSPILAGVPALTTNLRVAKLVPELSIATAVSPQFQRRDMAVTVTPIRARPYRPAGSLLRGD